MTKLHAHRLSCVISFFIFFNLKHWRGRIFEPIHNITKWVLLVCTYVFTDDMLILWFRFVHSLIYFALFQSVILKFRLVCLKLIVLICPVGWFCTPVCDFKSVRKLTWHQESSIIKKCRTSVISELAKQKHFETFV